MLRIDRRITPALTEHHRRPGLRTKHHRTRIWGMYQYRDAAEEEMRMGSLGGIFAWRFRVIVAGKDM